MSSSTLTYTYRFRLAEGRTRAVTVALDRETLLGAKDPAPPPEWTRLELHQCAGCPLDPDTHPHCPAAVAMVPVIEALKDVRSHQPASVTIEAPGRTYIKETTAQGGASPLVGLVMATSGCPVLDRLRPMVETHLPFMTPEESTFRLVATYLLGQYLRSRAGKAADFELGRIAEFFGGLEAVNTAFCRRLNSLPQEDAAVNAVVILSTMGSLAQFCLAEGDLERLERLFSAHLA